MASATAAVADVSLRRTPPPPFSSFHRRSFTCSFPSSATVSPSISVSRALTAPFLFPIQSRSKNPTRSTTEVASEEILADEIAAGDAGAESADGVLEEARARPRPCELYACNIPKSVDIAELSELFKPYGTLISVEVTRDAETGISRGCGYVTMSSITEAKAAIAALDGTDLGGREIRVKFSVDMVSGRTNTAALNTAPKKNLVFESPHKVYVGNLAWSVRPEDLREHFSQVGTVVSARVLFDRKGGKNRVYGFLSFSSADELQAATEKSGSVFHGRNILVREVVKRV